jgi:hypothetical protein
MVEIKIAEHQLMAIMMATNFFVTYSGYLSGWTIAKYRSIAIAVTLQKLAQHPHDRNTNLYVHTCVN